MKLAERIRFRIADYIDDTHPEACWANLAMWAMGYRSFKETFWHGEWKDQSCTEEDGSYCGKCAKTGRLSW